MKTEKRLIDANAVIEAITKAQDSLKSNNDAVWNMNQKYFKGLAWAHRIVLDAPTVDAVEVVRCKDCMWARAKDHREPTETPRELICQCFKHHYIPAPWDARMAVNPDDFCSYGERRKGE